MAIDKIRIGIFGAAGYAGGELLRILLRHPHAAVSFAHSKSQAGKPLYAAHPDLLGDSAMSFTGDMPFIKGGPDSNLDVIFLCMGHGESRTFLDENRFEGVKVIDLSQDFRDESGGFVYGLPELQREKIRGASRIANPGCFATAIELALLPLAQAGQLQSDVHVSAVTGSTGAGQSLSATTHFSWRSGNISVYKAFTHQHLKEIRQSLKALQPGFSAGVRFVPYRGSFTRGILASCYTTSNLPLGRSARVVHAVLRRPPVYAREPGGGGREAGAQHQQVPPAPGKARRPVAGDQRDRQPDQRRRRAGRAEHEPAVRPRRRNRAKLKSGRFLIPSGKSRTLS
jgi:N-acetyl-gamma-glutamyl-phosphate reductase